MHEHRQEDASESVAYSKRHLLIMVLCCLIPAAIILALVFANIKSTYLPFLIILLCPLMMLLMHLPQLLRKKREEGTHH